MDGDGRNVEELLQKLKNLEALAQRQNEELIKKV